MDEADRKLHEYAELNKTLRMYYEHYKYFYKLTGVPIAAAILVLAARMQEVAKQIAVSNSIARNRKEN